MSKQTQSNDAANATVSVTGEYDLPLDRLAVWALLNDPVVLQQCIKGCDQVTRDENQDFHAEFGFRLGPLRKRLVAKLTVDAIQPPAHYQLSSTVTYRAMGTAKGGAAVYLKPADFGTSLKYDAEFTVEGWFSRLGQDLLRAAAAKYMKLFFERFVEISNQSG